MSTQVSILQSPIIAETRLQLEDAQRIEYKEDELQYGTLWWSQVQLSHAHDLGASLMTCFHKPELPKTNTVDDLKQKLNN